MPETAGAAEARRQSAVVCRLRRRGRRRTAVAGIGIFLNLLEAKTHRFLDRRKCLAVHRTVALLDRLTDN